MYRHLVKPLLDRVISLFALIVTFPIILVTGVALFIANKGSVFFRQDRPGKNGKIFSIIKFKTMTDERDESGQLLPDAQRLTPIGKIVRRTSIDELPQLFNVLKGDMSIVGPRPLLPRYLALYNENQRRRHEVKPGITGWAQVNGRNDISWERKFELDVYYVDHVSWRLDLKIIGMTINKVLRQSDVNKTGEATTTPFLGTLPADEDVSHG